MTDASRTQATEAGAPAPAHRGRATSSGLPSLAWAGGDTAWVIVSHLLTGILLYAGIGWLLSLWLGNRTLLVAVGALLGMFLSLYMIHRRLEARSPHSGKEPLVTDRATRILRDRRESS
ncbi:MAG: hypothetical protein ACKOT0_05455 [bacterium]